MFEDASSLSDVSEILRVPVARLRGWADQADDDRYVLRWVGGHKRRARQVAEPAPELKRISRDLLGDLLSRTRVLRYSHGFVRGRGPRSNAEVHLGQPKIWKVDITAAFQSIPREKVRVILGRTYPERLAEVFSGWVCRNGWLAAGNPAAPHLFNLYTVPLVWVMAYLAKRAGLRFSAYADDFYFSGKEIEPRFRATITEMMSRWGFKAHDFDTAKNRLMTQGKDAVIVTGLRLTENGEIRLPRPVFGEGTRLIKELKSGSITTEQIWIPRAGGSIVVPPYDSMRIERDDMSTLGFLRYCLQNDSHFRAWSERQLSAPEYRHILATLLGKREAERRETSEPKGASNAPKIADKSRRASQGKVDRSETRKKDPVVPETETGATVSDVLRIWDLEKVLGISKSTIYRKEKNGEFPPRVRLGDNSVGWREDEVQAWLVSRPRGMA